MKFRGLGPRCVTDGAAALWYSQGERYQLINIDPETWIETACELAGGSLTENDWSQFVSSSRPYEPAC